MYSFLFFLVRVILYKGFESFISANHFQYPRTCLMISEKLYFICMVRSKETIVIGYNLVGFLHSFMENNSSSNFSGNTKLQKINVNISKKVCLGSFLKQLAGCF